MCLTLCMLCATSLSYDYYFCISLSFCILFVLGLFIILYLVFRFSFFFSSRRRHTRYIGDWSSDVCSSDLRPGSPTSPGTSPWTRSSWPSWIPSRSAARRGTARAPPRAPDGLRRDFPPRLRGDDPAGAARVGDRKSVV